MAGQPTVTRLLDTVHEFFRRHWKRTLIIRDRLRLSEEAFHRILASVIGVVGGLTNLAYFVVSDLVKKVILSGDGDLGRIAATLVPWQRLLIPTFGGLAAGLILFLGLRMMSHPGLTNLLEAVVAGDGQLALRPALLNAAPSLVSMSTCASIGREVLLIQLSSKLASTLGHHAPAAACLTPNDRPSDVLPILLDSELRNVPVVDNAAQLRLVGTVSRAEALGLLSDAIRARSASC